MSKRIVIFLICTLLINSITSLALTVSNEDEQQIKIQIFYKTASLFSKSDGWMKTYGGI